MLTKDRLLPHSTLPRWNGVSPHPADNYSNRNNCSGPFTTSSKHSSSEISSLANCKTLAFAAVWDANSRLCQLKCSAIRPYPEAPAAP